jgi:protein-disulfide isomerase
VSKKTSEKPSSEPRRNVFSKKYWAAGVALVILCAAAVGIVRWKTGKAPAPVPTAASDLKIEGARTAPVTVTEFSDFRCVACKKSQAVLKEIQTAYPGKVRIIFKHFPLAGHAWSPLAHQAAECANRQEAFWPYMERLFQEQDNWSKLPNPPDAFLVFARDLHLSLNDFAACLTDEKVKEAVQKDYREGESLKVQSTPTFFINGERLVGLLDLQTQGPSLVRKILGLPPAPPSPPAPQVRASLGEQLFTPASQEQKR